MGGGGHPELLFKVKTKGVLVTLLRFLFNLIYFIFPCLLEKQFNVENSVSYKQINDSSKGKPFKSCFVVGYLFVVFVCLLVFKTGSHYITGLEHADQAGLKLTATQVCVCHET